MNPHQPSPQIALVTGAAHRIGRGIALHLARLGWSVGVHFFASERAAGEVVQELQNTGVEAAALQADLSSMESLDHLMRACRDKLGAPTCLVNNAALFLDDAVETLARPQWDLQLAVNLTAPVFLARAFAAGLPAGCQGNIINIIDQRVWKPTPRYFSYSASKAALWAATQTLAQALAPRIRVNAIGPGPTLAHLRQSPEGFAQQRASTLLQRGTTPDEIAAAIAFILDAPAMTGQMIALDGGQHLAWQTADTAE